MSPATRDTHLSEIDAALLFYMEKHFELPWKISQPGYMRCHLELGGISASEMEIPHMNVNLPSKLG